MNVAETFNALTPPETANRNLFNAVALNRFPFAKVAISNDGFPVILISSVADGTSFSQKNVRLEYLELTHKTECKVSATSFCVGFADKDLISVSAIPKKYRCKRGWLLLKIITV